MPLFQSGIQSKTVGRPRQRTRAFTGFLPQGNAKALAVWGAFVPSRGRHDKQPQQQQAKRVLNLQLVTSPRECGEPLERQRQVRTVESSETTETLFKDRQFNYNCRRLFVVGSQVAPNVNPHGASLDFPYEYADDAGVARAPPPRRQQVARQGRVDAAAECCGGDGTAESKWRSPSSNSGRVPGRRQSARHELPRRRVRAERELHGVCGGERRGLLRRGDGLTTAAESERDIKIEEQWMLVPISTNSSTLEETAANSSFHAQEYTKLLSTGHLTVDGWGIVDGKPNMTLAFSDELLAGFSNLSVLKLRNLSLQYIQLPALPKLHTLDISGDGLMVLDNVLSRSVFAKSTQPQLTLSLQYNMLIEIPSIVYDMPTLRVLQLQHNAIKKQRLSPAQFAFLSTQLTKFEVDADAFQTTGCNGKLVTFQSNPSVSICDPALWIDFPSSGDSSSSTQNQKNNQSDDSSGGNWPVWVGGIGTFLVIAVAVGFALSRKETLKQMLQGRHLDSREQDQQGGVTIFRDNVQQQSDAECYRVFQDAKVSDSSTLSVNEQMFESWRRDPRLIVLTRPLGSRGQKSLTWLGTYREDNVVVKTLPNKASEFDRTLFTLDMKTIARFSHPNVVRFRGVAWSKETGMQALLEYMDRGDLQTYIAMSRGGVGSGNSGGGASSSTFAGGAGQPLALACWWGTRLLEIALDIAQALLYMHTMKRASHGALTSRHVLLNHEYSAKLSNFMFVKSLAEYGAPPPASSQSESSRVAFKSCAEVVRWTAPEILSSSSSSASGGGSVALASEAVDIYSFGIILSELDTLEFPFERVQRENKWSEAQLLEQLLEGNLKPSVSQVCPAAAKELMLACLAKDPCERPTAAMVVQTLRELTAEIDRESSITASFLESEQATAAAPGAMTR